MKMTGFVFKIAALILAMAAIVCLVMAHMDKISDWLACLWAQVQEKKQRLCGEGCFQETDDDYEDWED